MPQQSYKLREGRDDTVDIEWKGMWKDFRVRAEGRELGAMNGQDELVRGASWKLSDGSTLEVRAHKSILSTDLQILRDGEPLPGSPSDPRTRFKSAAGLAFFIAGLNLVLGLAAVLGEVAFLRELGLGTYSLAFGAVFLGLGLAIRKLSRVALVLAIVIFALDALVGAYAIADAGGTPPIGGILFRVVILAVLIQTLTATRATKPSP